MDIVIKFNLEFNNSILDNEIQENNEFDEINFSQKENKIEIIKKIEEKWEDVCRFKSLYNKLKNCPLYLETMEEIANPEEVDELSKFNPELTKDNTMCQPGSFKNFRSPVHAQDCQRTLARKPPCSCLRALQGNR